VGRKWGVNFFLSHPLPRKPLRFCGEFFACDLESTRAKNPENFRKIVWMGFEIFRDLYVDPMARKQWIGQGVKTQDRSLIMLLDTPSHSAWSESSRSYSVATGHRPERTDCARATQACDRTPIERPTTPTQVTIGTNTSVDTEIDSRCTTFYSTSIDTMGLFRTVWPETNYFRFTLPVSDKLK